MKRTLPIFITFTCFIMLFYGCNSISSMTGRCLVSSSGDYLIVNDKGSPIVMSNRSNNESLFESLKTGDKIKITYDGLYQSYPLRTGVYSCKVLENGSIEDIPENILTSLKEMNWVFQ